MAGWRCYAVNDRPVAVVPTADGGADCLVFDFATGEMVPDRAYFAYVTPGSGKDVDVLPEAEFEARLAACRAEAGAKAARQVRDWAHRLRPASGSAADVATALGLRGTGLRPGTVTVDPPPPGYRLITISSEPGPVSVELRPAGRLLTRPVLDAEFGTAREWPIFPDSGDEGHLEYSLTRPDGSAGRTVSIIIRIRRAAAAVIALRPSDPR
jgi:hypothetical protein